MATTIQRSGDKVAVSIADGESIEIELADQEDATEHQVNPFAIKAVGDEGFAGYTAVWGDPQHTDLQGEYFQRDTDFAEEAYTTRPLIYHHGQNKFVERAVVGTIKSWHKDDVGLYCEGDFKALSDDIDLFDEEERALRAEYIKRIKDKIAAGELNFSSGAVSHLVKYVGNKIAQWWWAESSATGSPAEPRMTDISLLKAYKGLDIDIPAKDEPPTSPDTQAPQEAVIPGSETGNEPNETTNPGEQDMTPEEVAEQLLAGAQELAETNPEIIAEVANRLMEMIGEREEAVAADQDEDEPEKADDEDKEEKSDQERLEAALSIPEFMTEVKTEVKAIVAKHLNSPSLSPDKLKQYMDAAKSAPTPRGTGGVNPAPAYKGGNMGISNVKTQYERAGWVSADYAFTQMVMEQLDPRWTPDVDFQRSAVAAATKYFEERPVETERYAPATAKAMANLSRDRSLAAKANELEHTTNTGFGAEWMWESWSDSILEKARVENIVAQLFRPENMPTSPHNLRLESTDPTVVAVSETTAQSELTLTSGNTIPISKIGTVTKQMVAGTLGVYIAISREEIEDIGLDVVAFKRRQTDKAFMEAIDAILLNADASENGNINNNGAALAATSKFRYGGGDGLLHSPLKENTGLAVPMGAAPNLRAMRVLQEKLLAAYGIRLSDLTYIADVRSSQMLRNMEEFLTMDKIGDKATILTGQIGSIDSIPVLVSDQIKASAADGLISSNSANNTKGRILLMYKPNWYRGERRQLSLEVVERRGMGATTLMGTMRTAIQKFDTSSASVLYNITITN